MNCHEFSIYKDLLKYERIARAYIKNIYWEVFLH